MQAINQFSRANNGAAVVDAASCDEGLTDFHIIHSLGNRTGIHLFLRGKELKQRERLYCNSPTNVEGFAPALEYREDLS